MGIVHTTNVSVNVLIVDSPTQNYANILGYVRISIDDEELIKGNNGFSTTKHVKIFNHLLELTDVLQIYACRGSLEFALISKRVTREYHHLIMVLDPVSAGLKSIVQL